MRSDDPNLTILTRAVTQLGRLTDRMVFLGGCATGLLVTDPAAPEVRPTQDVDVITEVGSLTDYYRLADGLRAAGFVEDQSPRAPEPRCAGGARPRSFWTSCRRTSMCLDLATAGVVLPSSARN
jgi:hypothetical protein